MNLDILADLKRMRDDIHTLNDIVYGAQREAKNNEDLNFPIKSIRQRLTVINDIFARIEETWRKYDPQNHA